MANNAIFKFGTPFTLEASGASAANDVFVQADDLLVTASNHAQYTTLDFVLSCAYSVAPTVGSVVNLFARAMNIDGTSDGQVPSANYLHTYLGSFPLENVTSTQYILLAGIPLPATEFYCYLENKAGQTLGAGWTLKATPRTVGPD